MPRAEPPDRGSLAGTVAFFAVLTAVAGYVFWPSITTGFFIDDYGYLNLALPDGWWHSGVIWDFSAQVLRPVTAISIGIQQELLGFSPARFHLITLGLVVIQGILTYLVARRLGLGEFACRTAAALMVLHTTNGWTLAWTASTSSNYAVVLSLAVVLLFAGESVSGRQALGGLVLYVLALLSREIAIMVPFIVALIRYWRGSGSWKPRLRRSLEETVPLFSVLAVFLALRLAFSGYAKTQPETPRLVPILDWASFSKALPMVPDHLRDILTLATSPFHSTILPPPDGYQFSAPITAVAVAVWAAIIWGVVRETRAGRYVPLLGLGWFALGILPPVFLQAEITYGNYADLALPGLVISVGAIVGSLVGNTAPVLRRAFAVAGVGLLAFVAYNGGNTLVRPPPPPIARAEELIAWALDEHPDPPPGTTIVVEDSLPEDPLWTSNGDLFRVLYDDPSIQVRFGPPAGG